MLKISKKNVLWIKNEIQSDEVIVWIGQFTTSYGRSIFSIKNLCYFLLMVAFFTFFLPMGFVIFLSVLFLLFNSTSKINSIYIITNVRAISLNNTKTRKFISYYPDQFKNFEWRQNPDGSRDIIFRPGFRPRKSWRTPKRESGFMNITDVTGVVDLLRKLSESDHQHNWRA